MKYFVFLAQYPRPRDINVDYIILYLNVHGITIRDASTMHPYMRHLVVLLRTISLRVLILK